MADRAKNVVIDVAGATGVLAAYEGAATLDSLTVQAGVSNARPAPGSSHYAIVARGAATQLTLDDVIAEAMPGAPGNNAQRGAEVCSVRAVADELANLHLRLS